MFLSVLLRASPSVRGSKTGQRGASRVLGIEQAPPSFDTAKFGVLDKAEPDQQRARSHFRKSTNLPLLVKELHSEMNHTKMNRVTVSPYFIDGTTGRTSKKK